MNAGSPSSNQPDIPVFTDGLGERLIATDAGTGEPLQILRLRAELTAVPSFEFAVRERTARLMNFRHAYYARVRRVDRLHPDGTLAIVSDHVEGTRLSEILRVAHARGLRLDTNAALCLIRQILQAVALLHDNARDASHGAIAPERIVVTPHARVVLVEHVAGSALERLQSSRERLWQEFRVAIPSSAGLARFDHRADVNGIGMSALALLLGRPIEAAEFPHALPDLLRQARARSPLGHEEPLSDALHTWLRRALHVDVRRAFSSAPEALAGLDEALGSDPSYLPAPVALESFLSQYAAFALHRAAPPPAGRAAPPSQQQEVVPPALLPDTGDPVDRPHQEPVRRGRTSGAAPPDAAELQDRADAETGVDEALREQGRGLRLRRLRVPGLLLLAIALAALGVQWCRPAAAGPSATLNVQSNPPGVEIFVDGVNRGMTPATLAVPAGSHILELRGQGVPRVIPLQIPAGGHVSQYLEFADAPTTGMLVVYSQPEGALVVVDGHPRGNTPLTLAGLEPGDHEVLLQSNAGSSRHVVTVLAGTTASLVAPRMPAPAAGPVSGWISVNAPFTIEIHEDGRLIGTSDTDLVMLAAGRHVLELINRPLGLRQPHVVQVTPGKVATVAVDLPKGTVNLNASPWAEVWIDGARVGETPIGNLELPIGPHELVFRHPELGEQRHAVSVTTSAPVRLSVAMQ